MLKQLRSSQAGRNAAASYLNFVSVAACGLLSIPIAVHFLEKEALGLWAIVSGLISYLVWLDLGIGTASARLIAPAINQKNQAEINAWWTLSRGIMFLLGLAGGALCLLSIPLLLWVFDVPDYLLGDAKLLLVGAAGIVAASIPIQGVSGLFTAQGRYHWSPLLQSVTAWINLLVFYLCLRQGLGLVSYVWALVASLGTQWLAYWLLIRIGPMPPKWDRRGFERAKMRSLMRYSLNIAGSGFVEALSNRVPTLILGAVGGLGLVPLLHFTMRAPSLIQSLVRKTLWSFYPGLLRMQVSAAKHQLPERHRQVGELLLTLGLLVAGGTAIFNKTFVCLLAGPDFYAGDAVTLVLVALILFEPLARMYRILLNLSGNMGHTALFSFLSLVIGSAAAYLGYQVVGMAGLLVVVFVQPLVLGFYGVLHGAKHSGHKITDFSYRSVWFAMFAIAAAVGAYLLGSRTSFLPETVKIQDWLFFLPTEGSLMAGITLVAAGFVAGARCLPRLMAQLGIAGHRGTHDSTPKTNPTRP